MALSVLPIALSGLTAQTRTLAASASNVANVRTRGALPDAAGQVPEGQPRPYQPLRVAQSPVVDPATGTALGVAATVQPARSGPGGTGVAAAYDPDASFADAQGLVGTPAVDLAEEAVTQLAATHAYRANLKVLSTADAMTKALLDDTA